MHLYDCVYDSTKNKDAPYYNDNCVLLVTVEFYKLIFPDSPVMVSNAVNSTGIIAIYDAACI